jgi:hypothetical protein
VLQLTIRLTGIWLSIPWNFPIDERGINLDGHSRITWQSTDPARIDRQSRKWPALATFDINDLRFFKQFQRLFTCAFPNTRRAFPANIACFAKFFTHLVFEGNWKPSRQGVYLVV